MIKNSEIEKLKKELQLYKTWVPPGHFYSPIHNIEEVKKHKNWIQNTDPIPGINEVINQQLEFLKEAKNYYLDFPYLKGRDDLRYKFENEMFGHGDALMLYLFIRFYKPNKIIEVGSGFSSAIMLDTNQEFFSNSIDLTFIEPYPERLNSILYEGENITLIQKPVQECNYKLFQSLSEGDILFIDSTHVSKAASDVNFLFFEILPRLNKGVIIHIHDIGFNFEYPINWLEEGRAWNEAYLLRAFLMFNDSFEIKVHNSRIFKLKSEYFKVNMPVFVKNPGGSIYLRKIK